MALGTTVNLVDQNRAQDLERIVRPAQIASGWTTVIAAGGMNVTDNSTADILNPTTSITGSTRKLVDIYDQYKGLIGTTLLVRMGYAGTPSVSPVIQVFGRRDSSDSWKRLMNKNATPAFSVTLTTAILTDVTDGTYSYTQDSPADHAFDLAGCAELLFGVKTAYAVSAGSAATAFMQAKVI